VKGKLCKKFLDQRQNKNESIITKKINCMIYVNKLFILDQYVLVSICSKVNDDKMMKNLFEDVHREDSKKVD
jgi:hypothetical protein